MTVAETFRCLLVDKTDDEPARSVERRPAADLPDGDVLIRVTWSSLNYKDALAASGHAGVAKRLPHVPGIDAAGEVVESGSPQLAAGDQVLVTGYELGAGQWGGWAELIRVPADWVLPLPEGLSARQAMVYGTAGLTAGLAMAELVRHGLTPESGKVVVTGASGGVGSWAVALLAKAGFDVAASTGKPHAHALLKQLGAREFLGRDELNDTSDKPLLPGRWAAAIDTVGGVTLATLLRSTMHSGLVAACGLVGGAALNMTVFPFLLRGVHLAGIDSAWCPRPLREKIWSQLAGSWRADLPQDMVHEATLESLEQPIQDILAGKVAGRYVVKVQ